MSRIGAKKKRGAKAPARRRCGLCGRAGRLAQTECCGNWICDDADRYVLFSYAATSCWRNHQRYTLCGGHHTEGHQGRWQDCAKCRDVETEMYVWYGTNEYNFEVLANPPSYEPTRCTGCGKVIRLASEGYSRGKDGYQCEPCTLRRLPGLRR